MLDMFRRNEGIIFINRWIAEGGEEEEQKLDLKYWEPTTDKNEKLKGGKDNELWGMSSLG